MIKKYEIRFLPVGEGSKGGDAIVMRLIDEFENQFVVVVDGGYANNSNDIVDYVKNVCRTNKIDLVFNTHPDLDHIGGLIELVKSDEVSISKICFNRPWRDANLNTSYFKDGRLTEKSLKDHVREEFAKAMELESESIKRNIEMVHPSVGTIYFDCIQILGPSTPHYREFLLKSNKTPNSTIENSLVGRIFNKALTVVRYLGGDVLWFNDESTSEINETSIVLGLHLPDVKILLTGDVGKVGLNQALDYWESLDLSNKASDFNHLQLPHHGSRKNIDPSILERIDACTYYLSCPKDGLSEGHPSRRLINKILYFNPAAKIFTTKGCWLSHHYNVNVNGSPAVAEQQYNIMDGEYK